MRKLLLAVCIASTFAAPPSGAQVNVSVNVPGVSIGFSTGSYPQLVPIPGYPVYYAPQLSANYFFYDGMFWLYDNDNWYTSAWYDGPWELVDPFAVPVYVLRVPVRYYRRPPPYFRGWIANAPPRWDEHWGNSWEERRHGWDRWERKSAPPPAPLPTYQRQYFGNRYPRVEQQQALQTQNYRYRPQTPVAQQYYQRYERALAGRGQVAATPQGGAPAAAAQPQPAPYAPAPQAERGQAPTGSTGREHQRAQRDSQNPQRAQQQSEQAQRAQQRQAEQAQHAQQQAQQRQAQQAQRSQQQAQQRQAEQAQHAQQQAQQRQAQQAQRSQQQAQQRQAEQAQRAQQQAQQHAEQQQHAPQGKGHQPNEQQGG